jgi:hypothetical protein
MSTQSRRASLVAGVLALTLVAAGCSAGSNKSAGTSTSTSRSARSSVTVSISGGLQTVAGDGGRPIVLVAALLGVSPAVFRRAFSGVTPAQLGVGPTTEEAQRNKAALLSVLAPYDITNDELDAASNTYRYDGAAGQSWPHTAASAVAIVSNGVVTAIKVTIGGSGYTSPPTITLSDGQTATATLTYGPVAASNGSITAITVN